jgi:hypothetical protein
VGHPGAAKWLMVPGRRGKLKRFQSLKMLHPLLCLDIMQHSLPFNQLSKDGVRLSEGVPFTQANTSVLVTEIPDFST